MIRWTFASLAAVGLLGGCVTTPASSLRPASADECAIVIAVLEGAPRAERGPFYSATLEVHPREGRKWAADLSGCPGLSERATAAGWSIVRHPRGVPIRENWAARTFIGVEVVGDGANLILRGTSIFYAKAKLRRQTGGDWSLAEFTGGWFTLVH